MKNVYAQGYKLSIENSKALLNCADKSAEINEFGIARSLCILSAEEAIKAVAFVTRHHFPSVPMSDFDTFIKDHKSKHKFIAAFITEMYEQNNSRVKSYEEKKEAILKTDSASDKKKKDVIRKMEELGFIKMALKQKSQSPDFNKTIQWWKKANDEKNKGFYVGLSENKLQNPRTYNKKQFQEERKYTFSIIEYVKNFKRGCENICKTFGSKTIEEAVTDYT